MSNHSLHPSGDSEAQFAHYVADLLRRNGWEVLVEPQFQGLKPDLVAERFGQRYIVEIKRASEGRKDRIIPLLSQAVLELQHYARNSQRHVSPVAVVVASYIPESVAEQAKRFVHELAPEVAIGLLDLEGFRLFSGHGLEGLSAERAQGKSIRLPRLGSRSPQLFSDLNQWMLKVLLAPDIAELYLSAPRERYQGASQVAQAAGVSMMSAFRFVEQFSKEGFLEHGPQGLHLVRWRELLDRWMAANRRRIVDIPMRWILRRGNEALQNALRGYEAGGEPGGHQESDVPLVSRRSRACLGLFSAAEALGIGFVHGVQPFVYLERMNQEAVESLGLSANGAEQNPDLYIRIPANRESVFRAAVIKDGVPVSDIFQVWLDIAHHPLRGKEQADQIWRRILAPVFERNEQR